MFPSNNTIQHKFRKLHCKSSSNHEYYKLLVVGLLLLSITDVSVNVLLLLTSFNRARDYLFIYYFYLLFFAYVLKLRSHILIRYIVNAIRYKGSVDRDTTTAGSQLYCGPVLKETKSVKKY